MRARARLYSAVLTLAAAGLALAPGTARADAPPPDQGWTRAWSDDFNGASGTAPSGDWIEDTGTGYPGGAANWGTGEIETYTGSTENVHQNGNGQLAIQPIKDGAGNWTSGRIETKNDGFAAPAGGKLRVSARVQLPNGGKGIWPAFWMLGAPFRPSHTNWPGAGEVDILENVNNESAVHGTFHCGTSPGGPCNETTGLGGSTDLGAAGGSAGFHTYSVELDTSGTPSLTWSLDGRSYFSVNRDQVGADAWNAATGHGFFVLFNVAVGGGWPGNPDGSTTSGDPMLVDWVTVDTANG